MVSVSAQVDVAQPSLPDASQIKAVVHQGLAEGASAAEMKAELVSRFGPEALSIPAAKKRRILVIGLLAGAAVVGLVIWSRSRNRRRRAAELGGGGHVDEHVEASIRSELASEGPAVLTPGSRTGGRRSLRLR